MSKTVEGDTKKGMKRKSHVKVKSSLIPGSVKLLKVKESSPDLLQKINLY